jgi:hypothetical protein
MEVVVDGGVGDGVLATAIDANDVMVAAASTAAAQLTTMTAIGTATISQRHHHRGRHCAIIPPPSQHRFRQRWPPSTKTTIAVAAINHRFHQQ